MRMQGQQVSSTGSAAIAAALQAALDPLLSSRPTAKNPEGLRAVAAALGEQLTSLGFKITRHTIRGAPDVLVARRPGKGNVRVGLSAHYDVEEASGEWRYPPFTTTIDGGRLFGRGTADNLGPLMLRLHALASLGPSSPELVWVLQGQEEVGSPAAHALYPELDLPPVDLWLEETGYFERDGRQRMLVRRIGARVAPCVTAALDVAAQHGRPVDRHDRHLNKAFGEHRCPFLTHLAGTTAYLALGPNDPDSRIHAADESLPISNLAVSHDQLCAVLRAAAEVS